MTQAHFLSGRLSCQLIALALATCLWIPQTAYAQDASDAARAQDAFDQGMSFYTEKEYAKAVVEFRKGYELMPAGLFLYNIALSYIKLGEFEKARRYAVRADEHDDLPTDVRAKNAARIDALGIRLQAAALAGAITPAAGAQEELFGGEAPGSQPGSPSGSSHLAADAGADKTGPAMMTYIGAGTALVGVGLIGGAAYMGADLGTRIDELGQVDDRDEYHAMRADIESDRVVGQVLLFSGIGLAAVGSGLVVWDLMGAGEASSAEVSVRPQLGAVNGAEVRWQW